MSFFPLHSIDDPMVWGVLPFKFHFNPSNHRWSLGAYDICFTNRSVRSSFFALFRPSFEILGPPEFFLPFSLWAKFYLHIVYATLLMAVPFNLRSLRPFAFCHANHRGFQTFIPLLARIKRRGMMHLEERLSQTTRIHLTLFLRLN